MDRAYGTHWNERVIFHNGLKPVATKWIEPTALLTLPNKVCHGNQVFAPIQKTKLLKKI